MTQTIKVITDGACDLPRALVEQYDITVVPIVINMGGESIFDDGLDFDREAFYDTLQTLPVLPTTAAPPVGKAQQLMEQQFQQADHLLIISVASAISGVHNSLRVAAEAAAPGAYTIFDSGQLSMGLGWLALRAAQMAAAGHPLEAITAMLEDTRQRVRTVAALYSLNNLRRSGRVNWASAMAGNLLQIKPLINFQDGEAILFERVRTFKRVPAKLAELAFEHRPIEALAVLHANNLAGAQQIVSLLADLVPPDDVIIVNVTPAIGIHVSPGSLGISLIKAKG